LIPGCTANMPNLILSRRAGESIQVGDDIVVTVTETNNSQARISIKAPQGMLILRTELKQRDVEAAVKDTNHVVVIRRKKRRHRLCRP